MSSVMNFVCKSCSRSLGADADHRLAKLVTSLEHDLAEQRRLLPKTSGRVSIIADSSSTEVPFARLRLFGAAPAPLRLTEVDSPGVGLVGTSLVNACTPAPAGGPATAAPFGSASSPDAQVCVRALPINQSINQSDFLFC